MTQEEVVEFLSGLSVLDIANLVKTLEAKWGVSAAAPVAAAAPAAAAPAAPVGVPVGTAPRGFALYVGLDELKAAADGVSLSTIVTALRQTLAELAPHAESYATVALAPLAPCALATDSRSARVARS